ncbi:MULTISPECIES: hypothetical protein [unclassified Streptomyces]|uniref:hypothetical protein n=1 Tax=unclassified Streptomyces TaxID=2593676 RepID=UPI002E2D502C|nr:hypothetical protein [Streptomyces sp. NBC_01439]
MRETQCGVQGKFGRLAGSRGDDHVLQRLGLSPGVTAGRVPGRGLHDGLAKSCAAHARWD